VTEYEGLVAEWKALRGRYGGLSVREVACVHASRTLLIGEVGAPGKPVVSLAAGVHGDEPAAPWALLSVVRDGLLDGNFGYRIWPCTNPSGYEAGTRRNAEGDDINRSFMRGGATPEARAIITANRDRSFALSLDLHEDFESTGFYCYEPKGQIDDGLGAAVLSALRDAGFTLQEMQDGYDLGYPPEAHATLQLEPGRVVYDPAESVQHLGGLPYSTYMLRSARRAMTFESPRSLEWNDRIAIHRTAVVSAIERLHRLA
jgi:protein MpaA